MNDHWIKSLPNSVLNIIDKLTDDNKRELVKFSLTGDIYSQSKHWGLANTVFLIKLKYVLNLQIDNRKELRDFILSFSNTSGYINDPLI